MIINNWELKSDFYSINPQLKLFYQKYDKEFTSDMLWGISLMIDFDSKFISLPFEDRLDLVSSELKVSRKILERYVNLIENDYQNTFEAVEMKVLRNWQKKMRERDDFLGNTPYDLDNVDTLDKMMANTKKLYDDLERVKKDLERVKNVNIGTAGRERSLSDKREI